MDIPGLEFIPNWDQMTLRNLQNIGSLWIKNGYAQGEHNQEGQGIPHIRPFNVTENGSISLHQIKYVSSPSENSVYWLLPRDVIFNNTNSEELVGKTAYFDHQGKFVLSNRVLC